MREEWAAAFSERARAYWTPARTAELSAGKSLAILPAAAPELLRALGILHRDGTMPPPQRRKFFQVNHMVAMLGPALRELSSTRETIRIVDAACGGSYLTLLLAWTLAHGHGRKVEVLGVDRNDALVAESARRTEIAGLGALVRHHACGLDTLDVATVWRRAFETDAEPAIDAVIALHACDTATDDALELGVRLGAHLLAVAPCCQAELARKWERLVDGPGGDASPLAPIHRPPHLRRETAALVTDAMRQWLLQAAGYQTWALEFVPTEHTRKNLLLRAVRRGEPVPQARTEYERLREATGGEGIALADRLASTP